MGTLILGALYILFLQAEDTGKLKPQRAELPSFVLARHIDKKVLLRGISCRASTSNQGLIGTPDYADMTTICRLNSSMYAV